MNVSAIVPVYNESDNVKAIVARLLALSSISQVVVVDDGSTDGGVKSDCWSKEDRVLLLRHERNRGKGAAIRTALAECQGEIIVIQDADLEYAPEEIPRLLEPFASGEADVVYGSRFAGGSRQNTKRQRYFANQLLTWLSNRLTGLALSDMETGHKAFRRDLLRNITLREERFGIEPELTAKLAKTGARFQELPILYSPRSYAEGKKIGVKDGVRALWCIAWYRLFD